jgi:hypothetical protein
MKTEVKNTKRVWRRGNVLDLAIVLLLIAAILVIGYRYYETNVAFGEESMEEYHVAFTVEKVSSDISPALRTADAVYFADGEVMGKLLRREGAPVNSAVKSTVAKVTLLDSTGNYVSADMPANTLVDLHGIISVRARKDARGTVLVNGEIPVSPGQHLTVHTETVTLSLTVTQITRK